MGETGRRRRGTAGEEISSGAGGIESGEDQVGEGRAEIGVRVSWGYFVPSDGSSDNGPPGPLGVIHVFQRFAFSSRSKKK
jgi:hypothetical protein